MHEQTPTLWNKFEQRVNRRNLIRGAAGVVAGAGFLGAAATFADDENDDHSDHTICALTNPIPGGVTPFKPFGVVVHHNPLNASVPLANINDPSQLTDFDGFVGLTHIRGGGTGTNTNTNVTTPLAFQADMGFSQGKFLGADGHLHNGTFAFV